MNYLWNRRLFGKLKVQVKGEMEKSETETSEEQPQTPVKNTAYPILKAMRLLFDFTIAFFGVLPVLLYSSIGRLFRKPQSVKGKICLVTGAGRGLGREISLKLASLDAEVVCVDIKEDLNNETVKMIKEAGGKAHGYQCNVAKHQDVLTLADKIQKEIGRVYMLINNAALVMTHKAGEWPPEDVVSMFNVNVISHYWTIQAFLPGMKDDNEGHIVSILSLSALNGTPGYSLYGATKAAGENLLCSLRHELNAHNRNRIKVTGIYPSVFKSNDDYKDFVKTRFGALEMSDTVEKTMDAILYTRTCTTIPYSLYFGIHIMRCMPYRMFRACFDLLNFTVTVPPRDVKATMPFNDILHKSAESKHF